VLYSDIPDLKFCSASGTTPEEAVREVGIAKACCACDSQETPQTHPSSELPPGSLSTVALNYVMVVRASRTAHQSFMTPAPQPPDPLLAYRDRFPSCATPIISSAITRRLPSAVRNSLQDYSRPASMAFAPGKKAGGRSLVIGNLVAPLIGAANGTWCFNPMSRWLMR